MAGTHTSNVPLQQGRARPSLADRGGEQPSTLSKGILSFYLALVEYMEYWSGLLSTKYTEMHPRLEHLSVTERLTELGNSGWRREGSTKQSDQCALNTWPSKPSFLED